MQARSGKLKGISIYVVAPTYMHESMYPSPSPLLSLCILMLERERQRQREGRVSINAAACLYSFGSRGSSMPLHPHRTTTPGLLHKFHPSPLLPLHNLQPLLSSPSVSSERNSKLLREEIEMVTMMLARLTQTSPERCLRARRCDPYLIEPCQYLSALSFTMRRA
jgi:hypothetical protein